MKRIFKLFTVLFTLVLMCVGVVGCNLLNNTDNDSLTYISMRINPEIELVVDEDGNVVAVNAINEDGEIVLSEVDLIGLTAEEAGELFTSMAIELGFIDVDTESATVYILTDGENEEFINEIEEKIKNKINDFFDEKGVYGKAEKEDLDDFKVLAEEWGVSLKEAKLIKRILDLYPEMTLEEIFELSFEERIELIKEEHNKHGLVAHLRNEYKNEIESLKEEYKELFDLFKELKELENQLRNKDLTDEEKAALQTEYDAKKVEYDALKLEYEAAIKAILDAKHELAENIKQEIKEKANERREENEEKVINHEEKVKEEENIRDKINEWRNSHDNGKEK